MCGRLEGSPDLNWGGRGWLSPVQRQSREGEHSRGRIKRSWEFTQKTAGLCQRIVWAETPSGWCRHCLLCGFCAGLVFLFIGGGGWRRWGRVQDSGVVSVTQVSFLENFRDIEMSASCRSVMHLSVQTTKSKRPDQTTALFNRI